MLIIAKDVHEKIGINQVNILGDYGDYQALSLHGKSPVSLEVKENLKSEIYKINQRLIELRDCFGEEAEIQFVEGNHEYRLLRYLLKNCPDLYDLHSIPELLSFDKLNIKFFPYGKAQRVKCLDTNLFMRHRPYSDGVSFALATANKKSLSLLVGHTHREQRATIRRADNSPVTVYCSGWLGDHMAAPFKEYTDTDDWSLGFSFTYAWGGVDDWIIKHVEIKKAMVDNELKYIAIYDGVLYEN